MNYELANKLKDAGFLFKEYYLEQHSGKDSELKWNNKFWEYPTLEELIEECGDNLIDLTRTDDGWTTNSENSLTQIEGKTPTEAVANLWLALNKKS